MIFSREACDFEDSDSSSGVDVSLVGYSSLAGSNKVSLLACYVSLFIDMVVEPESRAAH